MYTCKSLIAKLLYFMAFFSHIFAVLNADFTLLSCNKLMEGIASALISKKFLREHLDASYDFRGLSLHFVVCLFILLPSNKEKHRVNQQDLIYNVTSIKSILYINTVIVVVIAAYFMGNFFKV